MAFVVDSSEWFFDALSPEQARAAVVGFLDLVRTSQDRRDEIFIGDSLQSQPLYRGGDLWSVFGRQGPIELPHDALEELTAWLGRPNFYSEQDDWPENALDADLSIGGEAISENIDVAWVHHAVREARPLACLSLRRSGPIETVSSQGSTIVHFVRTERDRRGFWRAHLEAIGTTLEALIDLAPHAFPDLHFCRGAMEGASRFGGGYNALRTIVAGFLAVLDDHGKWIFTAPLRRCDRKMPRAQTRSFLLPISSSRPASAVLA